MNYCYQELTDNVSYLNNFLTNYLNILEHKQRILLDFLNFNKNEGESFSVLNNLIEKHIHKLNETISIIEIIRNRINSIEQNYISLFGTHNVSLDEIEDKINKIQYIILQYETVLEEFIFNNIDQIYIHKIQYIIDDLYVLKNKYELKRENLIEFDNYMLTIFDNEIDFLENIKNISNANFWKENNNNNVDDVGYFISDKLFYRFNFRNLSEEELNASLEQQEKILNIKYEDFKNMMIENYGFYDHQVDLLWKLKYRCRIATTNLEDAEYLYNLLTGRIFYSGEIVSSGYSSIECKSPWIRWDLVTTFIPIDYFLLKKLHFTKEEKNQLKYAIDVQHKVSSIEKVSSSTYHDIQFEVFYNYLVKEKNYKISYGEKKELEKLFSDKNTLPNDASIDVLGKYKDDMLEFEKLFNDRIARMSNKNDFAHQNIIVATDYGMDGAIKHGSSWLGDVLSGSLGPSDYKANLDSDNITNLAKEKNISYTEAEIIYYNGIQDGSINRAEYFKKNNPKVMECLENSMIFNRDSDAYKNFYNALKNNQQELYA